MGVLRSSLASVAACVLLLGCLPTPVGGAPLQSSDEQEVRAYRLTMPKLQQLAAAAAELAKLEAAHPETQALAKVQQERRRLQEKEELTDAESARLDQLNEEIDRLESDDDDDAEEAIAAPSQTLSDMVQRLEKVPGVAAAIRRAGLSTREFATIQLALLQASLTYGMMKASGRTTLPASVDVNPDNIKFVQQHEADIERVMKASAPPGGR